MSAPDTPVSGILQSRTLTNTKILRVSAGILVFSILALAGAAVLRNPELVGAATASSTNSHLQQRDSLSLLDSFGDGFPDGARLDSVQDRQNFAHWFTFVAETQFYAAAPRSSSEVQDCAGLIRFAYRNALMAHTEPWRATARLPFDPGFGDVSKYHYPDGPIGHFLFRVRPGPFAPEDLSRGAFAEFADSSTLLRYNTYRVSRDVRAAAPGDILFFHQSVEKEPFHSMLFVGKSYYQPNGSDWIVYHTGDIDGRRGEIREVQSATLFQHPDLHWRPLLNNPNFLGVYRLKILR